MARSILTLDWSKFIARPKYLSAIETAIGYLGIRNRNCLIFYGQSDLLWQFSKSLDKRLAVPYLHIRLNGSGLKQYATTSIEGVCVLRNQLVSGGVDCSCFDIALLKYLLGTRTHVVVEPVKAARLQSRADAFSALADLIGAGQDLEIAKLLKQLNIEDISPVARKFLPEIMEGVMGMIEHAIPPAVFLAKLGVVLVDPNEQFLLWIKEQRDQDLQDLKQINDPYEIPELLPRFLARDLKRHLSRPKLPIQQQKIVVFIDNYDALVDNPKTLRCQWLEQMMSQEESSPYVLWVMTSEKKLGWLTHAEQIPIMPLEEDISEAALWSFGIQEQSTCQIILEKAQGSPFYLNTCVNTCRSIGQRRSLRKQDIANSLVDALHQEIDTWDADERFILQLLSVPKQWNTALFQELVKEFHPALVQESNEDHDLFATVLKSPYVESFEANIWQLHPLVKEHLYGSLSPAKQEIIHNWLYSYYRKLYSETLLPIVTLGNILYHGMHLPNTEEVIKWVLEEASLQREKCTQPELVEILSTLIESGKAKSEQIALAWLEKGQLLIQLHKWENALKALETAQNQWTNLGLAE
mgnify:CR=1 FL=1